VTATARPIHIGSRSQVWSIEIRDERERLVCISRLTMAVLERTREAAATSR
jgi:1,4-dihydroxy-2-naphthoyl-CoA hydrolase